MASSNKESKSRNISKCEMNDLIKRVEYAVEHDLAISGDDLKLLLSAIHTLLEVHDRAERDELTLYKLKKLLGMVNSSEKRKKKSNRNSNNTSYSSSNKLTEKDDDSKINPPEIKKHELEEYNKGDDCPNCNIGKLYKHVPSELLRITGHSPYTATKHLCERYRCNGCLEVVSASLPDEILVDGDANQKYGFTARSLMAISKFYSGTPYNHQDNLNRIMGVNISSSTIYDQCTYVSHSLEPIYGELTKLASNAKHIAIDDTSAKILNQEPKEVEKPNGKKTLRKGVYTSGLIAELKNDKEIILYETSLGHAGDLLNSILKNRTNENEIPILMSDALSSNNTTYPVIKTYCNSHSRRRFYDLLNYIPDTVGPILNLYDKIWKNEREVKELQYCPKNRLDYHAKNSLPIMEEIHKWAISKLNSDDIEEHSSLADAIKYFIKNYDNLIKFCKVEGAKIDNNRVEERLKMPIRSRKMSHFYKTENGANVSNIITSVIATADSSKINIFDYLTVIQQNRVKVKKKPSQWMPWNYHLNLKENTKPNKAA